MVLSVFSESPVLTLRLHLPPPGEIGEHPVGIPNNLMPYVQQVRAIVCSPCCFSNNLFRA